jgi:hypothetical protein
MKAKMMYCCESNLVQVEGNNVNETDEMAYMLWDIIM